MKALRCSTAAIAISALTPVANAQIIGNVSNNVSDETVYEGSFTFSEVEYESASNNDIDIERKILGGSMTSSLGDQMSLLAQFGLTLESEYENSNDEGMGWMGGVGAKFQVMQTQDYTVLGHAMFNYINESYKFASGDLDISVWDLHTGATSVFELSGGKIKPYAGIDLVIVSDGEGEMDSYEFDIDRDTPLNVKFGTMIDLDSVVLRPEATIFGERTFTIAVSSK